MTLSAWLAGPARRGGGAWGVVTGSGHAKASRTVAAPLAVGTSAAPVPRASPAPKGSTRAASRVRTARRWPGSRSCSRPASAGTSCPGCFFLGRRQNDQFRSRAATWASFATEQGHGVIGAPVPGLVHAQHSPRSSGRCSARMRSGPPGCAAMKRAATSRNWAAAAGSTRSMPFLTTSLKAARTTPRIDQPYRSPSPWPRWAFHASPHFGTLTTSVPPRATSWQSRS